MKVLHAGDLHHDILATRLGKWKLSEGSNLIYEERLERTRDIIRHGISCGVDVYAFTGDIFNRAKPFPQEYHDLCQILDLIPEDKIAFIIPGNHDEMTARGCALQPLKNRRTNIIVSLTLETYHVQGYDFILAPWGTPIEDIKAVRASYIDRKPILLFHAGTQIEGLKWTEIDSEVGDVNLKDIDDLNCSAVLMGHFHGQVCLTAGKPMQSSIWYSGSPEIFNFGERAQSKGFLIWNFKDGCLDNVEQLQTEFPEYMSISPQDFLKAPPDQKWNSYLLIQGDVAEEERALIIEKLKMTDFGEFDYKLDLNSKLKDQKVVGVTGRSNREILQSYFVGKGIDIDEGVYTLDASLEAQVNQ